MKTLQQFLVEAKSPVQLKLKYPDEHPVWKQLAKGDPEGAFKPEINRVKFRSRQAAQAAHIDHRIASPYKDYLGVGAQSMAYGEPDESGHHIALMTKSDAVEVPEEHNAKAQWLNYAAEHAHENPHLPRLASKKALSSRGAEYHTYEMERLHPIDSLSREERNQMWHHAFGKEMNGLSSPDSMDFANTLRRRAYDPNYREIGGPELNPHLKAATNKIRNIVGMLNDKKNKPKNVSHHIIDLHGGNVMARKTPYGHQLVITDPVHTFQQ